MTTKLAFAPDAPAAGTHAARSPSQRHAPRARSIESTLYAIVLGGLFLVGAASFAQAFENLRESDALASKVVVVHAHAAHADACPML
jgi:hypothetical protein